MKDITLFYIKVYKLTFINDSNTNDQIMQIKNLDQDDVASPTITVTYTIDKKKLHGVNAVKFLSATTAAYYIDKTDVKGVSVTLKLGLTLGLSHFFGVAMATVIGGMLTMSQQIYLLQIAPHLLRLTPDGSINLSDTYDNIEDFLLRTESEFHLPNKELLGSSSSTSVSSINGECQGSCRLR